MEVILAGRKKDNPRRAHRREKKRSAAVSLTSPFEIRKKPKGQCRFEHGKNVQGKVGGRRFCGVRGGPMKKDSGGGYRRRVQSSARDWKLIRI